MNDIESIKTVGYDEIIQINVPVRFYFKNNSFDGIGVGAFTQKIMPWQEDMLDRCLRAISDGIGNEVSVNDNL